MVVRRANADSTGFSPNEPWTEIGFWGDRGTFFADVTGDLKADAIVSNNNGVVVRRAKSDGTGFGPNELWLPIAFSGTRKTLFADVTGDKLADAIAINDTGVIVRRSTGGALSPIAEVWSPDAFYGTVGTYVADISADGIPDLIAVNSNGIWARRGNRFHFGTTELLAEQVNAGPAALVDINGDRRADAVEVATDGLRVSLSRLREIRLRFVQFTPDGTALATPTQLDNVVATANAVYAHAGLKFLRWGSHVVTSSELAEVDFNEPVDNVTNLAAAKDSFNPGCNIGTFPSAMSEIRQLAVVSARCGLPKEVLVYVTVSPASYGFAPDESKAIMMTVNNITDHNTTNMLLAHELGHLMGLPHVFEAPAKDPQTRLYNNSLLWDLVYHAPSAGGRVTFRSRAEAAIHESSLLPIQRSTGFGGWWCPSNDPTKPCTSGVPLGTFVLPVADAAGTDSLYSFQHGILKGLALQLSDGSRTFNVMSYNHEGNPSNIQQRTPALSLSQIEQIQRALTFDMPMFADGAPIIGANGTQIINNMSQLGR